MARPGRPERNRAARSFRQLRRFHHVINSDKVFGTHRQEFESLRARQIATTPNKTAYPVTAGKWATWIKCGCADDVIEQAICRHARSRSIASAQQRPRG